MEFESLDLIDLIIHGKRIGSRSSHDVTMRASRVEHYGNIWEHYTVHTVVTGMLRCFVKFGTPSVIQKHVFYQIFIKLYKLILHYLRSVFLQNLNEFPRFLSILFEIKVWHLMILMGTWRLSYGQYIIATVLEVLSIV